MKMLSEKRKKKKNQTNKGICWTHDWMNNDICKFTNDSRIVNNS